jgi:Zn-dependent protease
MYFLLLLLFGYRDPAQGVLWAIGITISLLVHEFGNALVARHLRHDPSIMLHTFGGLTSRSRTGRDVEEAAIVAMGPAAGLLLGLIVFGLRQLLLTFGIVTVPTEMVAYTLLYPCVVWNLLNLLPMWPLDGGQLFRLGAGRWLGPVRAARITHVLSIAVIAVLAIYTLRHSMYVSLFILVMLGMQNIQGLQGQASAVATPRTSPLAGELVDGAQAALRDGNYKEAARLAHQARAQDGVSPAMMERIWEILGVATDKAGEYEEALAYLKRAPANAAVRSATEHALSKLGRHEELAEFQSRWSGSKPSGEMTRWLTGALSFIVLALALIFSTSLSQLLFR